LNSRAAAAIKIIVFSRVYFRHMSPPITPRGAKNKNQTDFSRGDLNSMEFGGSIKYVEA